MSIRPLRPCLSQDKCLGGCVLAHCLLKGSLNTVTSMVTAVASMAVDSVVCPSTGMRSFNTLLLANLSLHRLVHFHSLNFGSDTTDIGPQLHSMPINHSSIFLNVSPCNGLVRKSACMSSVGQRSTSNSCFSRRSVMQKHLMLRCLGSLPRA